MLFQSPWQGWPGLTSGKARTGDGRAIRFAPDPATHAGWGGEAIFNLRKTMRNNLGFLLQLAALTLLPLLIIWQLNFKFELLWMPSLTLAGVVLFWIGHRLRESD